MEATSIALDWINGVLYWADGKKKIIGKANVNGSSSQMVIDNVEVSPTSLIVLPCQRYRMVMFYACFPPNYLYYNGSCRPEKVLEQLADLETSLKMKYL